ncbi:MAG: FeoA family protein [Spirochaetales bacterium]|nr:FeoA family protein [Spirochaetales bacterium]
MTTSITKLSEIPKGSQFIIKGFENQDSEYAEKLLKMGFVEGTVVERTSADISDPMVFSLRHCRVALRKKEAAEILVKTDM